jgi:hypothetical protein
LVRGLTERIEMAWLIHPAEVAEALRQRLALRLAAARRQEAI